MECPICGGALERPEWFRGADDLQRLAIHIQENHMPLPRDAFRCPCGQECELLFQGDGCLADHLRAVGDYDALKIHFALYVLQQL